MTQDNLPSIPDQTITFKIQSDQPNPNTGLAGYLVTTDKNPYIMVWRDTKLEAVAMAMTRYLERLYEIENPQPKDTLMLEGDGLAEEALPEGVENGDEV